MSPVPGAAPAPKDPIGRLRENPKSRSRQEKVVAAIESGDPQVAELEPLLLDRDKDLVRAAVWIAANVPPDEPIRIAPKVLPRIEDRDKRTAAAAIDHLADMDEEGREKAVFALGETDLARHITELDGARPRELKEALNGDDKLRARVAVAEVIHRGEKGEALLYEARSQKDPVVSGAAVAALRSMFLAGSLKPRARLDRLWLRKAKLRG